MMRNMIIATVAALLLGTAALAHPAEARCFWNGYAMECYHHYPGWWDREHYRHHHWGPPPWAYRD
jgi:hypothetical protein